jgi:hypothetical protein
MTLTDQVIKNIITRLIKSQDYRIEIVNLINAEFLQFAIDFFKKITSAKLQSEMITMQWYRDFFINENLPTDDIAINSGLNKKTIHNMYGSSTKSIVIEAAYEHYDTLLESIQSLVTIEKEIDLSLTIKLNNVSVELNISESLIVISTLAVKRAALRGGLWSTAGKSAEKYLMLTLCKLYSVDERFFDASHFVRDKGKKVDREVDFYLINDDKAYLCEVKLMGRGNPEGADAIIARNSDIFIADTLSVHNKNQCDMLGIHWVSLREKDGYKKFKSILVALKIPHIDYEGNIDNDLEKILSNIIE